MTATPVSRFNRITEEGLCVGCGICQALVGEETIQIRTMPSGYQRPVVVGELSDRDVDRIYAICPGTMLEGLPETAYDSDTRHDNVWGPWQRMVRAYAADPQVRFEGSTGGVLSALAQYLLRSKRVDFIFHAKASLSEPTFGAPHVSLTEAQVMEGAGSRYGPTAILTEINDILARNQPFAFIGKPCDISALRNYSKYDDRVDKLVKFWLTPVCGGFFPPDLMNSFLAGIGIDRRELTGFRYRGRGCPGPMRAETADKVVEAHYVDMWGTEEGKWTLPWRCKICPDGIGDGADIAASDTWIGGSPNREDSKTDPGTNAIIARTAAGRDLIEAAERDGALTIEYDVAPDDLSVYQPHQMHKKYAVWARLQGLADEGYLVPKTERLRLEELAAEMPERVADYERNGTRERVRAGKAREDTPV